MPAHRRPWGALTTVVSSSLLLAVSLSSSVAAVEYPTWDDVQAARQNQAAAASTAAGIEGFLMTLETEAAQLGRTAQIRGESYSIAREALDEASIRVGMLEAQAQDAAARADRSRQRAAQLISQLARTGGGHLSLSLVLSPDADDLLGSLATMTKLTEQSTQILTEATRDRNLSASLTDQARVAETARTSLARDAQAALADANRAATAVSTRLAEQQAAADQLYEQLAALKGSTAEVERLYIEGKTDVRPTPGASGLPVTPRPTSPANPGPRPGVPPVVTPPPVAPPPVTPPAVTPPVVPPPSAPSPSAVEAAIAFATAQLGDRYKFSGYGPDEWDCSGLTKASYSAAGVYIGAHGSTSQYRYLSGQGRLIPISQLQRGDLLFYSEDGSYVYHTALYLGDGRMIEAQYEGIPVKVSSVRYYDLVSYVGRPTG
jgi:peptidoglycan DL-endopeptidase CwlO